MTFRDDLFQGKTVLVTGGTSGIGAATALAFAGLGAAVIAVGLNTEGPHAPRHPSITCRDVDVGQPLGLETLIDGLDRLDVLVNCAGISLHQDEYRLASFEKVLAINLTATMRASSAALPLLKRGGGAVVNIASMFALFGSEDRPAYAASKGGIVQLTKSLAQAYARDGVRVNAVAPGWIDTPLSTGLMADVEASGRILARTPQRRWGGAGEVANAIVFLAAPAASFITGAVLAVDGGYHTV